MDSDSIRFSLVSERFFFFEFSLGATVGVIDGFLRVKRYFLYWLICSCWSGGVFKYSGVCGVNTLIRD